MVILRRSLGVLAVAVLVLMAATSAGAVTVKETDTYRDLAIVEANVCIAPPEGIAGNVMLHVNFKVTYNDNKQAVDASLHVHAHGANLAGFEIVQLDPLVLGAPTGVKYVIKDQLQAPPERVNLPGTKIALRGIATIKLNRQFQATGLLGGDDFYLRIQVLAYEDLTGNQNVVVENVRFDCK
jgi:hypothetical protein